MTVTSRGPHGEPVIENPPSTRADMTSIITYASAVGNRVVVSSTADMTTNFIAKFGAPPWDGLECFNTATDDTHVYNAGTGQWEDADRTPDATTTGVFTPATGWAYASGGNTGSQTMILNGNTAQVYVSFYRIGGQITVPSDGNITNVVVGTLSAAPKMYTVLHSGANGRLAHFGVGTNGQVSLTAVTPGQNINAGDGGGGDGFSFGGTYFI